MIVCFAVFVEKMIYFCHKTLVLFHLNKHMIKLGQHFGVKYEACDEKFHFPGKVKHINVQSSGLSFNHLQE